jgi:hypothetical protein
VVAAANATKATKKRARKTAICSQEMGEVQLSGTEKRAKESFKIY